MSAHFDPRPPSTQFSTIIYRLDQQDKMLTELLTEAKKTNGRVTKLEQVFAVWRGQKAVAVSLLMLVAGLVTWAINLASFFHH